jgi:hypothetical protein
MPFDLPILLVSGAQAPEQHAAAVVHSAPFAAHAGPASEAPASGGSAGQQIESCSPQLSRHAQLQDPFGVQQEKVDVHS